MQLLQIRHQCKQKPCVKYFLHRLVLLDLVDLIMVVMTIMFKLIVVMITLIMFKMIMVMITLSCLISWITVMSYFPPSTFRLQR